MSFAQSMALSWQLGFRIGFDGWSKSCRPGRRNLLGARRDKIPGDLSGQELACLWSMPIPRCVNLLELAMNVSIVHKPPTTAEVQLPMSPRCDGTARGMN